MPDLTAGPVRYEVHGDVAEIVLDRPPLNLYGAALQDGLVAAVARAAADRPRALLFRAEGDVFTAGVDVHGFDGQDAASYAENNGGGLALTQALEDLPLPTIAVVHGLCLTVGLELSLACDLLWAADDARFGLVERRVGISPGMGGTQRMAERAGTARAREFVMTGRLYGAEELREWGVVNRVVPRERLLEEARAVAADLAAGPTLAMAATKAVVRAQADEGTRGADARIAELTAHLIETEDARTAVAAFLENGPRADVAFRGR
ncbi:enoyl-CoA hydratase/isomerase family protein [Patulibacter americanus]|uniref:enoyl-CoA hydratase/isomerase family protein n=1 Tax=Patulibacter americanus TaxID=588672 RepID=UPI0003B4117A|nr:enoyl-CoA hydratase/isomerase family protein [Patulibacter americanus]